MAEDTPENSNIAEIAQQQAAASEGVVSIDQVKLALRRVKDPDLNLNIIDMGLVYAIAVEANSELSKFAETKASELNQNFVSLLDKASKNAPAGSDVGVAAVKSMLSAANSAYDTFSKVAKQATEIAEANASAATEQMKGFAKAKKVA